MDYSLYSSIFFQASMVANGTIPPDSFSLGRREGGLAGMLWSPHVASSTSLISRLQRPRPKQAAPALVNTLSSSNLLGCPI